MWVSRLLFHSIKAVSANRSFDQAFQGLGDEIIVSQVLNKHF